MRKRLLVGLLWAMLVLSACGTKNANVDAKSSVEVEDTSAASGENATDGENVADGENAAGGENVTDEAGDANAAESVSDFTALTEIEKDYFTEFIQKDENYGFVLSTYADAKDVDLYEVFYLGAGYDAPVTQEQYNAYLKAADMEEVMTELTLVTREYMDELLLKRTGYQLKDMTCSLEYWTYIEEFDMYGHDAGDTNYMFYEVVDGSYKDDLYILRVKEKVWGDVENLSGFHTPDKEVALQKVDGEYRFLSCRYLIDENAILPYCYNMVLPDLGEVTFMAYEPDRPGCDVNFIVYKGDKIQSYLSWDKDYNNTVTDYTFDRIVDVGFSDYNNDGMTDLAMVIVYITESNEEYYQLRVYSGTYYGFFKREEEKAQDCYACVSNTATTEDIRTPVMFDLLSSSYKDIDYDWKEEYLKAAASADGEYEVLLQEMYPEVYATSVNAFKGLSYEELTRLLNVDVKALLD